MATWTRSALISIACTLAASASLAGERTFDQRFNAPPGGRLTLDTEVGSVAVVGGDARQAVVHAEISGSDDFLDHLHLSAVQDSQGVTVTGRVERDGWFGWFGRERVHFTIDVPRDYPVDLRTGGGSLDVRDLKAALRGRTAGGSVLIRDVSGSIDTHTAGGSIDAARLSGPTRLDTAGGGIGVTDCTGDLQVRTAGGGIRLEGIDGKVIARTAGGSVDAELRGNRGISLVTSGGSIALSLPATVRASLDAHTGNGHVESNIPLSSTEITDHSLLGAINGGGEPIYLRTSSGNIRINRLD
jgi:hypothetical protein